MRVPSYDYQAYRPSATFGSQICRPEEIFKKLSKDKKLSYCDALSVVIITDLLDDMPCLTFDHDFRTLGLVVYPA